MLGPSRITALELVCTAEFPLLPHNTFFYPSGIFLFCNLEWELAEPLGLQWGPRWQPPSVNSVSIIFLIPNSDLQYLRKTEEESKVSHVPACVSYASS